MSKGYDDVMALLGVVNQPNSQPVDEDVEKPGWHSCALSDDEIEKLTLGFPIPIRKDLEEASFRLGLDMKSLAINETWRDLLDMYRRNLPEIEMIEIRFPDGDVFLQPAMIDRVRAPFSYPEIESSVEALHRAIEAIEKFDPDLYRTQKVKSRGQAIRGSRSKRGPKYPPEKIDSAIEALIEELGRNKVTSLSVSDVIRRIQTRWDGEIAPGEETIRKRVNIKFPK